MTRRQPQGAGTGKGAGEVILLRELRCVRCGCRSTDGDGFTLADSTLTTIDHAFTLANMDDTHGTIAAVCSKCAPHVAELLAGVAP
jgi:hypothetical protein